jgi:ribosomal protein S18 acetylase RimI-like enzyme
MLTFHEIECLTDPHYDALLDLYQRAFPLAEQVPVSQFNILLRRKSRGELVEERFLTALDEAEKLVAFAIFGMRESHGCGYLGYIAVQPEQRSGGVGSQLLRHIIDQIKAEYTDVDVIAIEVEHPGVLESEEERLLAERRIQFYRRHGALLLTGIHYLQSTGWQPPLQMHLMFLPLQEVEPERCLNIAVGLFGDTVERTGPLSLE